MAKISFVNTPRDDISLPPTKDEMCISEFGADYRAIYLGKASSYLVSESTLNLGGLMHRVNLGGVK